jgi:hypothetical protein
MSKEEVIGGVNVYTCVRVCVCQTLTTISYVFLKSFFEIGLYVARLVSNPWTQVIFPHQSPEYLEPQTNNIVPSSIFSMFLMSSIVCFMKTTGEEMYWTAVAAEKISTNQTASNEHLLHRVSDHQESRSSLPGSFWLRSS